MQQQSPGCSGSHWLGDLEPPAEHLLGEFVELRIGHDEEDQCGYEGVLGLQEEIHVECLPKAEETVPLIL